MFPSFFVRQLFCAGIVLLRSRHMDVELEEFVVFDFEVMFSRDVMAELCRYRWG